MKNLAPVASSCLALLLMASCTITPAGSARTPSTTPLIETPAVPAAAVQPTSTPDPTTIALTTIKEGLAPSLPDLDYTVKYSNGNVEVSITAPNLADEAVEKQTDAKWVKSITDTYIELGALLVELVEQCGVSSRAPVLYVLSGADSEVYLTIAGGRAIYSIFDAPLEIKADNPPTISKAEFDAIQVGMSYQEIVDIIGSSGTVLSQVDIGVSDYKTTIYQWDGEGILGANANVTIQGGEVVSKAQFGLE